MSNREYFSGLDGLRGLAASVVVLHHYSLALFPGLFFADPHLAFSKYAWLVKLQPIELLLNGPFSVAIFFVLSGFVLSKRYFSENNIGIHLTAVLLKRYVRLTIPMTVSLIVAVVLFNLGLMNNKIVSEATGSIWFGSYYGHSYNLYSALWDGLWGVYLHGRVYLNPVVWSMAVELKGSILVYVFMCFFSAKKVRWLLYLLLLGYFYSSWILPFILGIVLADVWSIDRFRRNIGHFSAFIWPFVFLAGIYFSAGILSKDLSGFIPINGLSNARIMLITHSLGALCVVWCVLTSATLYSLLSQPIFRFLGRISYSMYLIHFLVLSTFTGQLFIWLLERGFDYIEAAVISSLISFGFILLVSTLFEILLDRVSVRLSTAVFKYIDGLVVLIVRSVKTERMLRWINS